MVETRFADAGGHQVAYQVIGEGPPDLVLVPGFFSDVEAFHAIPGYSDFLTALADFARVITLDFTPTGRSGRSRVPSFQERDEELRAVLGAVRATRPVLFGITGGGAVSVHHAVRYPQRTEALILYASYARFMASRDLPFMVTPELLGLIMQFARAWGEGNSAIFLAPSLAVSAEGRQLWRDIERSCGDSVHAPEVIERETEVDVVELLPSVDVPTLVLHRVNEQFVPPQAARYLANAIRGARLVHLDGMDHFPWMGDSQAVVREIKVFITGELRPDEPSAAMTAVLITDIVGSTELVIGMGDRRWNETLQRHDEIAAGEVDAAGGKLVKSTGDGVLAVFDHPAQAVSCAVALRDAVQPLGLDIRCGVTVGEVTFRPTDVTGVSVHIAERLANLCRPGQILVSRGVRVLLAESEFNFVGLRPLKGVPGGRSVFELTERGQGTSA